MNNTAFLFVCHKTGNRFLKRYRRLQAAVSQKDCARFFFHQKERGLPRGLHSYPCSIFSDKDLSSLGYPVFREKLTPGSTHFPLLFFYLKNPGYKFYWFIEYDVCFTGNWKVFFDYWSVCDADFLTSHIRWYNDEPDWVWWRLAHPEKEIPKEKRLRSFNTIYRISNKALSFIHQKHLEQWRGHEEELLPTLLYHHGFSLCDFGGSGPFVRPEDKNRFYIDAPAARNGALKKGTMRWRPVVKFPRWRKNTLYHPVK